MFPRAGCALGSAGGCVTQKSWQFSKMADQVLRERGKKVHVVLTKAWCAEHRFPCKEICHLKTLGNESFLHYTHSTGCFSFFLLLLFQKNISKSTWSYRSKGFHFYFYSFFLLYLRVKTTFQQRNVEKGKGKSIKLFYDFFQEELC